MNVRGQYIITWENGEKTVVPNTIVSEGASAFLATLFQSAALSSFYVGLCNQVPDEADTLTSITTEPTDGVNGYARIVLARNATDWPSIVVQNGESVVTSKAVTFTAAGGDFDAAHSRLFLCDAASGTVGALFSYSAAIPTPTTLVDTTSFQVQYQMFLS